MANFWDDVSLASVPEFEKPIASGLRMALGNDPDAIAHTPKGGSTIYVDKPSQMTQPILNHELVHRIQQKAGNFRPTPQNADQSYYSYGGLNGLKRAPSIAALNSEQQANIPQDYTAQMAAWGKAPITPQVLQQADQMNTTYARPMRQLATMAQPGNTIDTTPAAPGPPPAALTGMIKPLPEIGGQTLYATHQDTGHRIMTQDGGKTWKEAR